ncbi:MAG: FkbM family methyltransferase [Candidatus Thermoplasmatota archaeon]|nr:FkbM family methyltransferase [Candidatus Thermoplasmatota archaeon]
MVNKLLIRLLIYTIYGENRKHNFTNLLKKKGSFILSNNFRLNFNKNNKNDVENLFAFCIVNGVEFSDKEGYWHYRDNIITTPTNIRFNINKFDQLIFSETFLSDVHFSDFELKNKIVVQAGGFIGDTALYYASRGAIIYSFEPDINSYNLALENMKLNPELSNNIVMKNYAIGSDGDIDFPINPNGSGGSSAYDLENRITIKVKSVSLSTILKEFSIESPFLLDLDIKGNEFEIINDESIAKFEMVRIEYSTHIGNKQIGSRKDIIYKLREYGFNKIRIFKHNEGIYDLNNSGTIEAIK